MRAGSTVRHSVLRWKRLGDRINFLTSRGAPVTRVVRADTGSYSIEAAPEGSPRQWVYSATYWVSSADVPSSAWGVRTELCIAKWLEACRSYATKPLGGDLRWTSDCFLEWYRLDPLLVESVFGSRVAARVVDVLPVLDDESSQAWIHGDLSLRNMVYSSHCDSLLIDYGHSGFGPVEFEIGNLLGSLAIDQPGALESAIAGLEQCGAISMSANILAFGLLRTVRPLALGEGIVQSQYVDELRRAAMVILAL